MQNNLYQHGKDNLHLEIGGKNMILAYVIPLLMVTAFFIAVLLLMDWLAKLILYSFIIILLFLPFFLLYKAEAEDEKR
ncbi:hypothetical protein [Thalassobacillus devorans]|uniref:hypothetical protein n=2 Tax=Thalassobacillus TaxID=331971 RepID=UPI00111C752A|nr:hypothetical protein [Thalassobacillus devorans]